jgi:hypothetical protein
MAILRTVQAPPTGHLNPQIIGVLQCIDRRKRLTLCYSNRAFLWPAADPDSRMMIGDMSWATAAHRAANHDHQMMLGVIAFPMVASPPNSCWQQDRQGLRLWD